MVQVRGQSSFFYGHPIVPGLPGSSAGKESTCSARDTGLIPGLGRSPGEGIGYPLHYSWTPLVAQPVKNLPAILETWVRSLGWETPWRRTWQPTPVFLPGESPWTEQSGGLQSMGPQRVRHDWVIEHSTSNCTSTTCLKKKKTILSLSELPLHFGHKSVVHIYVGLLTHCQFHSIDLFVSLDANSTLSCLLQLNNTP